MLGSASFPGPEPLFRRADVLELTLACQRYHRLWPDGRHAGNARTGRVWPWCRPGPFVFLRCSKDGKQRKGRTGSVGWGGGPFVGKCGAGEGNRTLVCSLGSCRSTIELRPQRLSLSTGDLRPCDRKGFSPHIPFAPFARTGQAACRRLSEAPDHRKLRRSCAVSWQLSGAAQPAAPRAGRSGGTGPPSSKMGRLSLSRHEKRQNDVRRGRSGPGCHHISEMVMRVARAPDRNG